MERSNFANDTITRQLIEKAGYFCRECGNPIYQWPIPGSCMICETPLYGETIGQEPLRVMTVEEELQRLDLNQKNISEKLRKDQNDSNFGRNGEGSI